MCKHCSIKKCGCPGYFSFLSSKLFTKHKKKKHTKAGKKRKSRSRK